MAAGPPTKFGAGTVTLDLLGTPLEFSCYVSGGNVGHEYNEEGEEWVALCGKRYPSTLTRADTLNLSVNWGLTASGLYQYLQTNDLGLATCDYVPNTADAALWAGTVQLTLPENVGADEYGGYLAGDVTWAFVDETTGAPSVATFTAGADPV